MRFRVIPAAGDFCFCFFMCRRLQTVLAHAGIASRRKAAELIERGKVKVDGRTVFEKGMRVDPRENVVFVDGRRIQEEEKKYYFLFNKPSGVISSAKDTHDREKVTDFFKHIKARLYPVGRLDKDTTGLILITNDGELTHKLSHPSFEVEKEYRVVVKPFVKDSDIKKLQRGIEVEGKLTAPCTIKLLKRDQSLGVYKVQLHEGRKRQIRVMFETVGSKVTSLERNRYAGFTLRRLKPGEYRELTEKEINRLKKL